IDRDLNKALDLLKAQTAKLVMEQSKTSDEQAARTVIETWDCRVSQVVDVNKGLHCFTAKPGARRTIAPLPERETDTYLVRVGRNADLNRAMDSASWAMMGLFETDRKLSRLDAYALASMVRDCRLAAPGAAAPAAAEKAVHCLVPKSTWVAR